MHAPFRRRARVLHSLGAIGALLAASACARSATVAASASSPPASSPPAAAAGLARPQLVLKERVAGMPATSTPDVQVLTATIAPGARTVLHTHRSPVTVYVLEGTFTLELADRAAPIVVRAGEAFVEPPNVRMTGYNRTATGPTRVVIFYVTEPGAPFLDPVAP